MDADKLKSFLLHHFEKVLLVPVLFLACWLVHRGLQQEQILQTHQPDRMIQDARRLRDQVDQDHNDLVLAGRSIDAPIPIDRPPLFADLNQPLAPEDTFEVLREDPRLYPPEAIRVHGVLAPLAVRSYDDRYPLKYLEDAEPIKVDTRRADARRRKRQRQRQPSEEELELWQQIDGSGQAIDGSGQGDEQPVAQQSNTRRLRNPLGFRPSNVSSFKNNVVQYPEPGEGWFIAGTAVVPYASQIEAYEHAFGLADRFDPHGRDQPVFLGYELQRADVTDKSVSQLKATDWINRYGRREHVADAVLRWAGFAPEIVPADYRADTTLTMWIPPVMLTDYSTFALHPLIPMLSRRELAQRKQQRPQQNRPAEVDPQKIDVRDARDRNRNLLDTDQSQEWNSESGISTRVRLSPPKYKLIRFYDFNSSFRDDPDAPQPGRKYVYRVRVMLEDPNFPQSPKQQPSGQHLAPAVYQRILKSIAAIRAAKDPRKKRLELAVARTPWSKPSAAVSLPARTNVFIGSATSSTAKDVQVGERLVPHDRKPVTIELVVSDFISPLNSRLSMRLDEVRKGDILRARREAGDIVDPISLKIKKFPQPLLETQMAVIDIEGGRDLEIHKEKGLKSPAMMLLFDPDGGLKVHDEIDDQQYYRIESFADERGE